MIELVYVEDNPHDAELVEALIRGEFPDVHMERVETKAGFEELLLRVAPDLILSDFSLPSFDGLTALSIARRMRPDTPFIFLSGTIGEEVAVEALKNGAIDYVLKDRLVRLVPAVQRALAHAEEQARRRRAEADLRETQELYRQITENVADLIAVLDPSGRRIYNNPAYEAILGRQGMKAGSNSFGDVHPEDRERVQQIFKETVRTGVGQRTEYRILKEDGSVRYIESQGSVVHDDNRAIVNVLVVSRDVTERKQAEDRIREQASLLDKARDAICVTDLVQRITYWNASAESLFGWSSHEALGENVQTLLFSQDAVRHQDAMTRLLAEGSWKGELHLQAKSGENVIVESRWTLVSDNVGSPRSILLINTDITERKRLEVQFLRAQRMESIGTLAGGIAHDLNNVLTPILVASQVLQAHAEAADKPLLETIEKSAIHGAALIKQVLLFARGAEGEHSPMQLRHVINDMEKLLRETLPRSIQIRARMEKDLWLVRGDATQLNQVLMNLCINARDALPNGGCIEIAASNFLPDEAFWVVHPEFQRGPTLLLTVSDTGTGIPPKVLERIWDPFFTTKEVGKGTGLGLSTVLGIVKGHGGAVNVQSEPGAGSRFEIYLPALPLESPVKMAAERPALQQQGNGEGILVVDDEPYVRDVIGTMLRYCGYKPFKAGSGVAGIEVYQKHRDEINVALVDMMMPGLDGAATMRQLRATNPGLLLVAMSGMLENAAFGSGSDLEGVELLRKPITADTLLSTIGGVLARPPVRM